MNWWKLFRSALFLTVGIFVFVLGGVDDSPGAQLLGVVLGVIAILILFIKE